VVIGLLPLFARLSRQVFVSARRDIDGRVKGRFTNGFLDAGTNGVSKVTLADVLRKREKKHDDTLFSSTPTDRDKNTPVEGDGFCRWTRP